MGRSDRKEDHRDRKTRHHDEDNDEKRKKQKKHHRDDKDRRSKRHKEEDRRRHKKEKRRRDYDDSSSSVSDRRHKRKKHHESDKKSSKKKKHSKEDKSKKEKRHKKINVDKSKLYPLGDPIGHPPTQLLDPEADYFSFHKHLWLFLYRDRSIVFNDLSSDQARGAFRDFCQLYNAGKLEKGYYSDNLPNAALDECKTTRHSWGLRITDREDKSLQVLTEGVHKQTEYRENKNIGNSTSDKYDSRRETIQSKDGGRSDGTSFKQSTNDRQRDRLEYRRMKEHVRVAEEEFALGGGKGDTARDRQILKRKEISEKTHGASRDHEAAMELSDAALYGNDDEQIFQKQLAASKQRTAQRQERQQARVAELQKKEQEKQVAMLEMLGLSGKIKAGQKVQIVPRNDEKK